MKKLVFLILLVTFSIQSQNIGGFYLSRYSPVINMGTMDVYFSVGGLDFYGNPRLQGKSLDMGAAEFQDPWDRIVTANVSENSTIFKGDSVKLMASGGEIYRWNTGDTGRYLTVAPLQTTTYTVEVEEYGVMATAQVTVTVVDNISPNPISNIGDDFVECLDKVIILSANGAPNSTYSWSNGETTQEIMVRLTQTQLYSVTISTLGNNITDSIMIYVDENCN